MSVLVTQEAPDFVAPAVMPEDSINNGARWHCREDISLLQISPLKLEHCQPQKHQKI